MQISLILRLALLGYQDSFCTVYGILENVGVWQGKTFFHNVFYVYIGTVYIKVEKQHTVLPIVRFFNLQLHISLTRT